MHIWYVKHYAGGPGFGKATRAYHLARAWQSLGHEATVFVARFHHVLDRPEMLPPDAVSSGVRYVSLPARRYAGNGLGRLLNIADFCRGVYGLAARSDVAKPDAIIVSSPHPFAIFPGRWLARRFSAKLVFEVRDLWPLSITELTGLSRWHPFVALAALTERFAYRHADLVASLLGGAEPYMRAKGLAPGKFVHVPNGVGEEGAIDATEPLSGPGRDAALRMETWRTEGRLVLIHPGAQGAPNALDRLLEAIALLNLDGLGDRLGVVLLGEGDLTPQLRLQAASLGLRNVAFFPNVPKGEALWLTERSDAGYVGSRAAPELYRYGVSFNKVTDYLRAGLPTVLAVPTSGDAVSASGAGIVSRGTDPRSIADAIAGLLAMNSEDRRSMGLRGKAFAEATLDYRRIATTYAEAIRNA
ncbi:MAG: glycosyltransferase family 4 protein [Rhizobiaceae bacterium]